SPREAFKSAGVLRREFGVYQAQVVDFPLPLHTTQTLQGLRQLDELADVEFLGAGVFIELEVGEDARQYRPGQGARQRRQEIDSQGLAPMCERTLDQTKQRTLVALGPGQDR